jgi:hypothetical protein
MNENVGNLQFNQPVVPPPKITPRQKVEENKSQSNKPFPGILHWLNIQGFIKTTTTIPTIAPKSLSDQIVLYIDNLTTPTSKRLYIYSREADIWSYVTLT